MKFQEIYDYIEERLALTQEMEYFLINYEGKDDLLKKLKKSYFLSNYDPTDMIEKFKILNDDYDPSISVFNQVFPITEYIKNVKKFNPNIPYGKIHSILSYLCLYKKEEVTIELIKELDKINFNFDKTVGLRRDVSHHLYILKVSDKKLIKHYFKNYKFQGSFSELAHEIEIKDFSKSFIKKLAKLINHDFFTIELWKKDLIKNKQKISKNMQFKNDYVETNNEDIIEYCKKRNIKFVNKKYSNIL